MGSWRACTFNSSFGVVMLSRVTLRLEMMVEYALRELGIFGRRNSIHDFIELKVVNHRLRRISGIAGVMHDAI